MDATIEKLGKRLQPLMGDISFMGEDRCFSSTDQFLEMCKHNSSALLMFEEMEVNRKERIWNIFSNILAAALQKVALEKHESNNEETIRAILKNWFTDTDSQTYWTQKMRLIKQCFLEIGLTEDQYRPIQEYFDKFPMAMVDYIMDLIKPWSAIPMGEISGISNILTDMYKEAEKKWM